MALLKASNLVWGDLGPKKISEDTFPCQKERTFKQKSPALDEYAGCLCPEEVKGSGKMRKVLIIYSSKSVSFPFFLSSYVILGKLVPLSGHIYKTRALD